MIDATQTELMERVKNNALMDARVSLPARIISFDPSTKTAEVEIMLKMSTEDGESMDYPPLVDCPCKFIRGGGFHVVHPYKAGDNGIVLFSDRCLDGWFETGKSAVPMDFRIHSMSDAYFLGGTDNLTDISPIMSDSIFIGKDDNSAGIQIKSDGELVFHGLNSTFNHDVSMMGTLTVAGMVNALFGLMVKGKDYLLHKHGGVTRGSQITDEVQ